jgi:Lar family restriction alleviation protein
MGVWPIVTVLKGAAMTSHDLKPCPFCGAKAEIVNIDEGENVGGSCVCCTRCFASSNVEFGFKENFVSNWNNRVNEVEP